MSIPKAVPKPPRATQSLYLDEEDDAPYGDEAFAKRLTSMSEEELCDVQWLYCKERGLTHFPLPLLSLCNMTRLVLNSNFILEIPEAFTQLSHLKALFYEDGELERLPRNFGSMTRMEQLFLCDNSLRYVPSLLKMTRLESLCEWLLLSFGTDTFPSHWISSKG